MLLFFFLLLLAELTRSVFSGLPGLTTSLNGQNVVTQSVFVFLSFSLGIVCSVLNNIRVLVVDVQWLMYVSFSLVGSYCV